MSDDQKTALEVEREKMEAEAAAENATRSGVGTRVKVGSTRGRSVQNIKYEAFDESQPETLPKDPAEFSKVTGITGTAALVEMLITGYNDKMYTDASDPIADYVNAAWKDEIKVQFRTTVRNMAKMFGKPVSEVAGSIRDAVNGIKDNFKSATA